MSTDGWDMQCQNVIEIIVSTVKESLVVLDKIVCLLNDGEPLEDVRETLTVFSRVGLSASLYLVRETYTKKDVGE